MKLEELEKLCAEATPSPWVPAVCRTKYWTGEPNAARLGEVWDDDGYASEEDCNFIAAARNMLPKLVAVAKAARKIKRHGLGHRIMCDDSCGCDECTFDDLVAALEIP